AHHRLADAGGAAPTGVAAAPAARRGRELPAPAAFAVLAIGAAPLASTLLGIAAVLGGTTPVVEVVVVEVVAIAIRHGADPFGVGKKEFESGAVESPCHGQRLDRTRVGQRARRVGAAGR